MKYEIRKKVIIGVCNKIKKWIFDEKKTLLIYYIKQTELDTKV